MIVGDEEMTVEGARMIAQEERHGREVSGRNGTFNSWREFGGIIRRMAALVEKLVVEREEAHQKGYQEGFTAASEPYRDYLAGSIGLAELGKRMQAIYDTSLE